MKQEKNYGTKWSEIADKSQKVYIPLLQAFIDEIESEEENDIPVKTKSVTAEEMVLDEAIMQMELSGHSFYIYKDEDSQKIAVVYARHNGGYGLIEVDE